MVLALVIRTTFVLMIPIAILDTNAIRAWNIVMLITLVVVLNKQLTLVTRSYTSKKAEVDVVKPMPLELIVIMRTTLVLVESVQLMDFVMMSLLVAPLILIALLMKFALMFYIVMKSMLIVPLFTPLIRLVLSTLLLVRMVVVEKSNHLVLIVMIQQMLVTALGVVPTNILVLSIVILQTDTCVMLARRARK